MKIVTRQYVQEFLERLGSRYPKKETLSLLGGSAMLMLGSLRETMDIDYVGDDIHKNEFQIIVEEVARELNLETEAVPIDRFIPLPEGSEKRKINIGQFGRITAYIFDPYSIALSKLDRGSDRDMDDLVFLIRNNHIHAEELERILKEALPHAGKFDFHPEILAHFQELKKRLEGKP